MVCMNVMCANPCCHCGTSGWVSGVCCPCASCNLAGCEDLCCTALACWNPLCPLMATKWGMSFEGDWEIFGNESKLKEVSAFCCAGCCCTPCIWLGDAIGKLGVSQGMVQEAWHYARTRDNANTVNKDMRSTKTSWSSSELENVLPEFGSTWALVYMCCPCNTALSTGQLYRQRRMTPRFQANHYWMMCGECCYDMRTSECCMFCCNDITCLPRTGYCLGLPCCTCCAGNGDPHESENRAFCKEKGLDYEATWAETKTKCDITKDDPIKVR